MNTINRPPKTPQGIPANHKDYKTVEKIVLEFLPKSQTVLKLVLAVALSSQYKNDKMLWMMIVGVPSSGKTDAVRLITRSGITHYLDTMTQNAFISGERETEKEKVFDLLPELHHKTFIIKDLTAIFSLDEKATRKMLGDFVNIYDGEFKKHSSRRGTVSYKSEFSFLACITPSALNKHTQYMNMVGPRFLSYHMPESTEDDQNASFSAFFSGKDRADIEKKAQESTSDYLRYLYGKSLIVNPLEVNVQTFLRLASELMARCRGIAVLQKSTFRDVDGKDVTYYESIDFQIEEPWRAIQQLTTLSIYLAVVVGKEDVTHEELSIIKDVVLSSMPADRSQTLRIIIKNRGTITVKELSEASDKASRTTLRLLDELVILKVLDKKHDPSKANIYTIKEKFRKILLVDTAEFLSDANKKVTHVSSKPVVASQTNDQIADNKATHRKQVINKKVRTREECPEMTDKEYDDYVTKEFNEFVDIVEDDDEDDKS